MRVVLDDGAFMPTRAHVTDAGLDIRSMESGVVPTHGSRVFHTGVHIEIPKGCAGLLVSKSGLNIVFDVTSTGLIDEGYTGAILVKLFNHGKLDYWVKKGDKISQLVIIPVINEKLELSDALPQSERGMDGFGSTGKQ